MKAISSLRDWCLTLSVASFSALAGIAAQAETTDFKCVVNEDNVAVTVQFRISNLASIEKAKLQAFPGTTDETGPILVTPKQIGERYVKIQTLNDQGGDLRMDDEKLLLFGDGAGIDFVNLVLFKDSNYTKGYVRGSGAISFYQKISCATKSY